MKNAILILEDNSIFRGFGFGACGTYSGELVFDTAMTGYVEAMTDPSYAGQILTFSFPLIGNYGVSEKWFESKKIYTAGIVISESSDKSFHTEQNYSLNEFLINNNVGGIEGVDTRSIVKKIRSMGHLKSILVVYEEEDKNYVHEVSNANSYILNNQGEKTVVLIDYGVKNGIINELTARNIKVVVVPAKFSVNEILQFQPDGIVLSNGPGDPLELTNEISVISNLLKMNIPVFGICLGHQLLGLAMGAKRFKLPFGHRGVNHPVICELSHKAFITSQNHGYALDLESLPKELIVTYKNLNDDTIEGIMHKNKIWFSVQFHPEAKPGPKDTLFLYDEFVKLL